MRTEQELYSYRFRQVDAQPELSLNAKMMDGSRLVINEAVVDELGDLTKAVEPVGYQLVATDFENLVCPAFTFFNPEQQTCSRLPYAKRKDDVDLVNIIYTSPMYTPEDGSQPFHVMSLTALTQSQMFLSGEDYQPELNYRWAVLDEEILNERPIEGKEEQTLIMDYSDLYNDRNRQVQVFLSDE